MSRSVVSKDMIRDTVQRNEALFAGASVCVGVITAVCFALWTYVFAVNPDCRLGSSPWMILVELPLSLGLFCAMALPLGSLSGPLYFAFLMPIIGVVNLGVAFTIALTIASLRKSLETRHTQPVAPRDG